MVGKTQSGEDFDYGIFLAVFEDPCEDQVSLFGQEMN
jgi:hypothetical protein